MSKQVKRKITVNQSPKQKATQKTRPSVFERLGTKTEPQKEICVTWSQSGSCPYGKTCKYSSTHTLISPSKRGGVKVVPQDQQAKRKHIKEHAVKHLSGGSQNETWNVAEGLDLEDADPDDLEKRRLALQRELDIQTKMEKAHKKQKKFKKESSPSSESSSTTSESSSSSDESTSSSSSSVDARHKRAKKPRKRDSSSSSEHDASLKKHKVKPVKVNKKPKTTTTVAKTDKPKKLTKLKPVHGKSPTPLKPRKQSQTPPPKIKTLTPSKKIKSESKSPRPPSRNSDKRDRHRTPSPKKMDKDRDKDKDKERERKDRDRERDKERERERERERQRDKKKEKSPKRDIRPPLKDGKKRGTPDSSHSRDRKNSPARGVSGRSTAAGRHKTPPRRYDNKRGDSRSKDRDRKDINKNSRERERERERERRIAREEREAAREKEREEALARCQERQRERERLKKAEEDARRAKERARREDRGLDKPSGDRVERLLPLPQDRIPPARKECLEKERHARDRIRRSPEDRTRSRSRKTPEKIHQYDRSYDRDHDRAEYPAVRLRDEHRRDERRLDSQYDRPREERGRYLDIEHGHTHGHGHHNYPDERPEYAENVERRPRRETWDERGVVELEHRRYREDSRPPVPAQNIKSRGDWVDPEYEHDWERRRHLDWEGNVPNREGWVERDREPLAVDEEWRHYNRGLDTWSSDDRRRWENENWGSNNRMAEVREPREVRPEREHNRDRDRNVSRDRDRELSRPRSSTSQRNDTSDGSRKEVKPEVRLPEKIDRVEKLERVETVEPPIESPNPVSEPVEHKKEVAVKRPADSPVDLAVDVKKPCVVEEPLADDLSEISDDADEILNRDEEILEQAEEAAAEVMEATAPEESSDRVITPVQALQSHAPPKSPNTNSITKDSIEDKMAMDFEEISEDELEEEARMKGLVDALGVDWASLVAESRPNVKPITSAKRRWASHNMLVHCGVSVHLLGKEHVARIYREHAESLLKSEEDATEENEQTEQEIVVKTEKSDNEENNAVSGGNNTVSEPIANVKQEDEEQVNAETIIPHPIAAIQVTLRDSKALRKTLFASAGPFRRALSARRDLAVRRNLCKLPITDEYVEPVKSYDPELFKSACQLLLEASC